jgi:hypothetical protein
MSPSSSLARTTTRQLLRAPTRYLLIIEVADTSLLEDRERKVPLYAESGIQDCWLVNLVDRIVEVYRQPVDGHSAQFRRVGPDDTLDIIALPGATAASGGSAAPACQVAAMARQTGSRDTSATAGG